MPTAIWLMGCSLGKMQGCQIAMAAWRLLQINRLAGCRRFVGIFCVGGANEDGGKNTSGTPCNQEMWQSAFGAAFGILVLL